MSNMTNIVDFIDINFGSDWHAIKAGDSNMFSILIFEKEITFVVLTLGLSNHYLVFESGEKIRQELYLELDRNRFCLSDVLSFIINFSETVLSKHQAIYDNELITYKAKLFNDIYTIKIISSLQFFDEKKDEVVCFMKIIPQFKIDDNITS